MLESGRTLTGGRGEVWFEPGHRGRDMCGAEGWHGVERAISSVCLGWIFHVEEEWEIMPQCRLEKLESQDDFILLSRKKWHSAPPRPQDHGRRWKSIPCSF